MARLIPLDEVAGTPGTIVVGVPGGPDGVAGGAGAAALRDATGIDVARLAAAAGFSGAAGEMLAVVADGVAPRLVRLVGLGDGPIPVEALRSAAMRAGATGPDADTVSLLALESADPAAPAAVVEGHLLGAWRYGAVGEPDLTVVLAAASGTDERVARAERVAQATNWVRELVATPPNELTPAAFAERILAFAAGAAPGAVTATVWDAVRLAEHGFGGTLGVGSSSPGAARVVELRVDGPAGAPTTALAGKGITFDAGGTNLKQDRSEIAWMKSDMAGAAAVAAAVVTAAALGAGRSLHAVLPITENMPGSRAQRPGDVVRHPDGRRTEVTDTDSEGRLVLADAIAWLAASGPDEILDVGTLTDSGALGTAFWGCWTSSPALGDALVAAGERAGDPGWRLPLHDSYAALLASSVADSANAPLDAPDTGAMAATFLRPFAGDVAWAHIDNGSSAWLERPWAEWPEGPTGTPLRALVEYLVPSR